MSTPNRTLHSRRPRYSIIIPAFNEAESLGQVVRAIQRLRLDAELLVVNDGSTDATARVARGLRGVRLLEHPYNIGNGAAVKTGIRAARGEFILLMDGDGQHRPADIPRLLAQAGRYDMVVGARSSSSDAAAHRTAANQLYNALATYITGHHVADLTSGFRAVRASIAKDFCYLLPNGFSYPSTLTIALFRAGYSVCYLPIVAPARRGQSKIKLLRDGAGFMLTIARIGTLFAPMKIFLPVAVPLIVAGGAYMAFSLGALHRFSAFSGLLIVTGIFLFMLGLLSEQIALLRMSQAGHHAAEGGEPRS
jgi:glycosyltransferase involved in cell wall biosynthesis